MSEAKSAYKTPRQHGSQVLKENLLQAKKLLNRRKN